MTYSSWLFSALTLVSIPTAFGCSGGDGTAADPQRDAGHIEGDASDDAEGDAATRVGDAGVDPQNDAGGDASAPTCASVEDGGSCEPSKAPGPHQGGDTILTWPCDAPIEPGQSAYVGNPAAIWDKCLELCPKYGTPRLATCSSSVDACHRTTLFCEYERL